MDVSIKHVYFRFIRDLILRSSTLSKNKGFLYILDILDTIKRLLVKLKPNAVILKYLYQRHGTVAQTRQHKNSFSIFTFLYFFIFLFFDFCIFVFFDFLIF